MRFCGVGLNRLDDARKKGGIKVHTMMDAFSVVTEFVCMTEAREHDRRFLTHLNLPANSWLEFDKAYNVYPQFAKLTDRRYSTTGHSDTTTETQADYF